MGISQFLLICLQELFHKLKSAAAMADLVFLFGSDLGESPFEAVRLEDGVPSEHVLATRCHNFAIALTDEDFWLGIWSLAERKDALSVRSLVVEALDHLIKAFTANASQEVLALNRQEINQRW
jgi:hypothetical protein